MKDSEDAQRWIRLKRYESPGEEYFEAFMVQLKERQRSDLLRGSARCLLCERIAIWYGELGSLRWIAPIGTAAAITVVGFYFANPSLSNIQREEPIASTFEAQLENPESGDPSLDEVITLQIPQRDFRVPDLRANRSTELEGLIPVGAGGLYREL